MTTVINARAQAFGHRDHDEHRRSVTMSWTERSGASAYDSDSDSEVLTRRRSVSAVRANDLVMLPSALDPLGRKIRRVTTDVVDSNEQLLLVKRRANNAKAIALRGHSQASAKRSSRTRRGSRSLAITRGSVSVTVDDFEFIKVLGVGAWGKVVLVRDRRDAELYAMKTVSKRSVRENNLAEKVQSERDVLGGTHHHSLGSCRKPIGAA